MSEIVYLLMSSVFIVIEERYCDGFHTVTTYSCVQVNEGREERIRANWSANGKPGS